MSSKESKTVTLKETIQQKDIECLEDVADSLEIPRSWEMEKADLVPAILDYFQENGIPFELMEELVFLSDPTYQAIWRIPKEGPQKVKVSLEEQIHLESIVYIHLKKVPNAGDLDHNVVILSLAKEAKCQLAFRKKELDQKQLLQGLVTNYTKAALYLYGVISPDELFDLMVRYERENLPDKLTPELLLEFFSDSDMSEMGMSQIDCFIWEDLDSEEVLIAASDFEEIDEEDSAMNITDFIVFRDDNPRWYPPTAEEFFTFKDKCTRRGRPEVQAFSEWLSKNMDGTDDDSLVSVTIENIIDEFQKSESESLSDIAEGILDSGLSFLPGHTPKEFQKKLSQFKDSLHLRTNNGYTNHDLQRMKQDNDRE